ncbi:MAG: hypothetical protein KAS71_08495, partial [Bacteroidales bacterium]|nr:hypothetical protein [Bacteroidales bacterium]
FYGYEFKGVFKNTGDALVANLVNEDGLPFGAGDAIYSDISGSEGIPDGIIDNFDKTFIGSPIPDFFGGFNSQIKYDKWKLDIMVQGVYGNEVFNYVRFLNEKMTDLSNQSQAIINRWQYEGHETDMPRSLWGDPVGNSAFSSRWIEDGSYLRLKNITLSYKIPDKFLVFRNAEFYVSGINLITLTNYLGYDPEFAFSYSPVELGIDYGLIPFTKTFMIGVKLGL